MKNYEDIINLPHHVSKKHKQMSIENRAAQFAPFAALTGYGDCVREKGRLTNLKIELDEEKKINLNNQLQILNENINQKPKVNIMYFVPDEKKDGGKYITITDNVKKIDEVYKIIYLINGKLIKIDDIIDIEIIKLEQ